MIFIYPIGLQLKAILQIRSQYSENQVRSCAQEHNESTRIKPHDLSEIGQEQSIQPVCGKHEFWRELYSLK